MKERLKMIFDRIDIFVVCIVFGCSLTVAEAYMGFWKGFAQCFIMTFLITEVCYTLRCNEKLEIELIETKEKLKDAEGELESAYRKITKKSKVANFYDLLKKLWKERWECEHAKVLYCKRKITSRQLADAMNHADKECGEISDKISELTKELNELYAKK
jgi:hypothetical protein|nr:MAG TPA: hypothetical protein [Caudoviricetes sp.]